MKFVYIIFNKHLKKEYGYYTTESCANESIKKYSEQYLYYESENKKYNDAFQSLKQNKISNKDYLNLFYSIRDASDKVIYDNCSVIGHPDNLVINKVEIENE